MPLRAKTLARPGDRQAPSRRAIVRRGARVVAVLGRHGLGYALEAAGVGRFVPFHRGLFGHRARASPYTAPEHVRMALEDLGPTFVKVGQLLSTRDDLLPPAYREEFARLQDSAQPEPPGVIEAVVARELGHPVAEVFGRFDTTPLAAASIGQVHTACLRDGSEVVVKVRRRGAREQVEVDLEVATAVAGWVQRVSRSARRADIVAVVRGLAVTLRSELDYVTEAANAERVAENFRHDPTVHIPWVSRSTSTAEVLTLERVYGIKVSALDVLDDHGVDRALLARRIVEVVLTMVFEHGFFHADPHPGNLFLEADGRLALVDFGMVGAVAPTTRRRLVRLFLATAGGDVHSVCDELLALGTATEPVERSRFALDVAGLLANVTEVPLGELRIAPLLQAEMGIVRRHRLRLPAELALLVRTAIVTEGVALGLDPSISLLPLLAPVAIRLAAEQARDGAPSPDAASGQ